MAVSHLERQDRIEFIRRLPLFSGLNEEDLGRLVDMAEPITLQPGEVLMEEGSDGDAFYVALDGEFEVTKRSDQRDILLALRGSGEILGELALLSQKPRTASVRATSESHVLQISKDAFMNLITSSRTATLAMLHTVVERLNNTQVMLQQSEKMAALGTLSAGLAHELNNPAAAAKRSAAQLREDITRWMRLAALRDATNLDAKQKELVNQLPDQIVARTASPAKLDPLARSDLESELQDWLDEKRIEDGWQYAPTLVSYAWDKGALEELSRNFSNEQFSVIVPWLAVGCSIYALLNEISHSAERLSEIVKSVKSYSYMDQAPVQDVDIHEGLEDTLVILRHKLKEGITVKREFAPNLPHIDGYGSELNQVWTNIIDNAIDAMKGKGEIKLKTYVQNECVVVEITDNGPGMSPEVQQHVFEAFFTTKGPGVGTGLGLHISHNIIAHKHRGEIKVMSKPGETTFQVKLPIKLKRKDQ
jgi:signal transduction histidine kinase